MHQMHVPTAVLLVQRSSALHTTAMQANALLSFSCCTVINL